MTYEISNAHGDVRGYDPARPHLTPSYATKHAVIVRDRRYVPPRILVEMGLDHGVFSWFTPLCGRRFDTITFVASQADLYLGYDKRLLRYYHEVVSCRLRNPRDRSMCRIVEPELPR